MTTRPVVALGLDCRPVVALGLDCRPVVALESGCRPVVALGLGCRPGTTAADLRAAVDAVLAEAGLTAAAVTILATVDRRADAVRQLAADRGWHLIAWPAAELARQPVPHPSPVVAAAVDTPSVAEAAALRAAGPNAELTTPKRTFPRVTVAIARQRPTP